MFSLFSRFPDCKANFDCPNQSCCHQSSRLSDPSPRNSPCRLASQTSFRASLRSLFNSNNTCLNSNSYINNNSNSSNSNILLELRFAFHFTTTYKLTETFLTLPMDCSRYGLCKKTYKANNDHDLARASFKDKLVILLSLISLL